MKISTRIGILLLIAIMVLSCTPKKSLSYLQDVEKIAIAESQRFESLKLQPGDKLVINVTARDLDVVKPFNQNYATGVSTLNGQITGNVSRSEVAAAGPTYIVNDNYEIDFPIIGVISTKNLSVSELEDDLRSKLIRYIKEPTVNIKLNNFRVSVMGEVNRPGEFLLLDGKGTLLSAISLAGDLTIYGKRDDVLVIRNIDGILSKERVNLTSSDFFASPFYNLKQGDVIYVSPNKSREQTSRRDPNATIYISVASIIVTILALVFRK